MKMRKQNTKRKKHASTRSHNTNYRKESQMLEHAQEPGLKRKRRIENNEAESEGACDKVQ